MMLPEAGHFGGLRPWRPAWAGAIHGSRSRRDFTPFFQRYATLGGDGDQGMNSEAYPALFSGSDRASLAAQRSYLILSGARLLSLVLAAAVLETASIRALDLPSSTPQMASAISLLVGLALTTVLRDRNYEQIWFDGRAVAESVKTASWRFMMQAAPFADAGGDSDAAFLKQLVEIRRSRPGIEAYLPGGTLGTVQITEHMRATRGLPLSDRRAIYLGDRLGDQQRWYLAKAESNRSAADHWFWIVTVVQLAALSLALIPIGGATVAYFVPLLTTLSGVTLTWTQVKRHKELAQAYALAGQELGELEALSSTVSGPRAFQEFVAQVEEAISREHTMWSARHDVWLKPRITAQPL